MSNNQLPTIIDYNDINFYIHLSESELETIKQSLINNLNMGMDHMEDKQVETLNNEVFNILENYNYETLHIIKIDNMNNMTIYYTSLYRNYSSFNQEDVKNYIIRNPELYDLKEQVQEQLIIITDITLYQCYYLSRADHWLNGYRISVFDRGNQVFAQILEEMTQFEQDGVNNQDENEEEQTNVHEEEQEHQVETEAEQTFEEGEEDNDTLDDEEVEAIAENLIEILEERIQGLMQETLNEGEETFYEGEQDIENQILMILR